MTAGKGSGRREDDQRSPQRRTGGAYRKLEMESGKTRASATLSPGKCTFPKGGRGIPIYRGFLGNYPIFLRSRFGAHRSGVIDLPEWGAPLVAALVSTARFRPCPPVAGLFLRAARVPLSGCFLAMVDVLRRAVRRPIAIKMFQQAVASFCFLSRTPRSARRSRPAAT